MALDTTVGSATADSMATLEEMETYLQIFFVGDPALDTFLGLDTPIREEMARQAARFFGYLPLRGDLVYVEDPIQSMPFPRTCQTDTTIIPTEVKEAQAEIMFTIIYRTVLAQSVSVASGAATNAQVKKFSLGGLLSIEFAQKGDNSGSILEQFTRSISSLTWLKLQKYITQVRGGVI